MKRKSKSICLILNALCNYYYSDLCSCSALSLTIFGALIEPIHFQPFLNINYGLSLIFLLDTREIGYSQCVDPTKIFSFKSHESHLNSKIENSHFKCEKEIMKQKV